MFRDSAGNDAAGFSDHPVLNETPDTTAPTVIRVSLTSSPKANATYAEQEAIYVTVTFDEPVNVTGESTLLLRVGDRDRIARYQRGMGAALSFAYSVVRDDVDADGVSIGADHLSLNGGTISDGQGNAAELAHPPLPGQATHRVDGKASPPRAEVTAEGGGGFGPAPVAPSFGDGFRTARAVAEDARMGDAVEEPVSATHPDDLEITYTLSGADAALFSVDEKSGQIRIRDEVDLVAGTTYTVNVTATDSAGFGAMVIVVIEVTEPTHHRYDANRNGEIERDEVIAAVRDYFKGTIERRQVIEVVRLYFAALR